MPCAVAREIDFRHSRAQCSSASIKRPAAATQGAVFAILPAGVGLYVNGSLEVHTIAESFTRERPEDEHRPWQEGRQDQEPFYVITEVTMLNEVYDTLEAILESLNMAANNPDFAEEIKMLKDVLAIEDDLAKPSGTVRSPASSNDWPSKHRT